MQLFVCVLWYLDSNKSLRMQVFGSSFMDANLLDIDDFV